MKTKLMYFIMIIFLLSCSHKKEEIQSLKQNTYVVITDNRTDTVHANYYRFGNYVGLGSAVMFFNNENQAVATIKKSENIVIKQIKQ